jgi:cation diffusion facilitator CzcD-associated flavoprotein CzcO
VDPPLPGTPPTFISPMYTNLFANTPRDVMTFSDKKFRQDAPDFPFRTQILQYLNEYGAEVKHLVDFNKEIVRVEKHEHWSLTIRDLKDPSKSTTIEVFDAVAVASGISDPN